MNLSFAYRTYRFTSSIRYWGGRKFTTAGLLMLAALGLAGSLGMDTNRTMSFQVASFLIAILGVSAVSSLIARGRFSARRTLPQYASAGDSIIYKISVKNLDKREQAGLNVVEDFEDPRPSYDQFIRAMEPGEERRNRLDRKFGYFRWRWLIRQKQTADSKEAELNAIKPGGETETRVELKALRRGYVRFTNIILTKPDAFGLLKSIVPVPAKESLLVIPKRYDLPPIQMPGSRKYNLGGVAMASNVGDSEEFVALRDYRPGDPLRKIHWKSWAKSGKPVVKEYQEEFFARHALILDTFQEKQDPEVFEEAVSVAASFVSGVDTKDSLLDLMFVGADAFCFTAGRSVGNTDKMMEILATVTPCSDEGFDRLSNSVIERSGLLSGCICVFLNWDDKRRELVKLIKSNGVPLMVIVMVNRDHSGEVDPGPMTDRDDRLRVIKINEISEGLLKL